MKKIVSLVLVLSLLIGGSALAFAYAGQQNRMTWQERLNLSEEQVEKIEELREEHLDKQDEVRDDLADKREELREMYFDNEANENEIMSLHQKGNQLRTQLADSRMEHRLAMRNVLSAEQLEECEDLGRFDHRGRRGARVGRREPRANRGHHRGGFGPGMRY